MVFRYKARNPEGKVLSGMVDAPDLNNATRMLHDKKLFVIEIKPGSSFNLASILNRGKRVKSVEIVNFTRQLSTMITAGLSLPEALVILRTQTTSPAFAEALNDIEHQIVGGSNLADALTNYSKYFSAIYISLIRAGESSGTLDKVLSRLAETMESQEEFKAKVSGALIYPIIIVVGMVAVVFIMMTVVVPKLLDLYKDFNIELPITTKILIAVSNFFVGYWWLMILAFFGIGYLYRAWRKTPIGQVTIDSLLLKIPIYGDLQKKVMLVDFTRTLAMLVGSGIHILEGLKILEKSLGNVIYQQAIVDIGKKVEKGFPLGETFGQYPIFPPIVSQMMKVGEETGKLDETLNKLSHYFQVESENTVKGLTTAIEPLIMVVLGVGVGFIVISVITPIYSLTTSIK